ncbi:MAG TPA: hypothetical protein VFI78_00610 [Salinimicrobium sp.]|nr:hypothetical protein [Salinimicrobium sp.]
MKAIKQTLRVKNNKVSITLPEDFEDKEVEIIVLSKEDDFELTDIQKAILDERANEPDENYVSAKKVIEDLEKKHGIRD